MTLDRWDDTAKITYDHATWNELCSLRFVDSGHNAVIMGPVGVGKTFLATALGHIGVRRRHSVHFERCDRLLKRLRASRLDNSHDLEMRKLLRVDLLIIDDFALQALDALDTADVYELIVERHRAAATVVTSNHEPIEWLAQMADALLAQSAIDRLQSAAHELVLDGESYRQRQKPHVDHDKPLTISQPPGDHPTPTLNPEPVPCHWRTGGPIKLANDIQRNMPAFCRVLVILPACCQERFLLSVTSCISTPTGTIHGQEARRSGHRRVVARGNRRGSRPFGPVSANAETSTSPQRPTSSSSTATVPTSNEDPTHEANETQAQEAAEDSGQAHHGRGHGHAGGSNEDPTHEAGESPQREAQENAQNNAGSSDSGSTSSNSTSSGSTGG